MTVDVANRLFDRHRTRRLRPIARHVGRRCRGLAQRGPGRQRPGGRRFKVIRWFIRITAIPSLRDPRPAVFDGGFVQQHVLHADGHQWCVHPIAGMHRDQGGEPTAGSPGSTSTSTRPIWPLLLDELRRTGHGSAGLARYLAAGSHPHRSWPSTAPPSGAGPRQRRIHRDGRQRGGGRGQHVTGHLTHRRRIGDTPASAAATNTCAPRTSSTSADTSHHRGARWKPPEATGRSWVDR